MKNIFATAASVFVWGFAVPAMAGSSDSTVSQIGIANHVEVEQLQGGSANNDNDSGVTQNGNSNYGYVNQGGNSIRNLSILNQIGDGNVADVDQVGDGNDINDSFAQQTGNGNYARVNQGDLINNNKSELYQAGNYNGATVNQGGANGVNTGDNKSYVYQYENYDSVLVNQGGAGAVNTSIIVQDLDDVLPAWGNYAQVTQNGSSTNISNAYQYGDNNDAYVAQGAASGVTNTSTIVQTGASNFTSVGQH